MASVQIGNEVLRSQALQFDEVDGLSQTLSEGGLPLLIRDMSRSKTDINPYTDGWALVKAAYAALCRTDASRGPNFIVSVLCGCLQVPSLKEDPDPDPKWNSQLAFDLCYSPQPLPTSYPRETQGLTTMEWLIHSIESETHNRPFVYRIWNEIRNSDGNPEFALLRNWNKYVEEEVLGDDMRFMTTRKGHVGWAHARAEQRDKIFVLPGCSVPVILRDRAKGGYTVVGDAYV